MTFTKKYTPNSRNRFFQFFATGTGHIDESFNPGFDFELMDIRIILSRAHPSATYLTFNLSAGMGSYYDVLLLSILASTLTNVTDQVWTPSAEKLLYRYNDTIELSMLNSGAEQWGLVVTGWSVIE